MGDPTFWSAGGFAQAVTLPTTLLSVMVRDSKMTMAWIASGLWNRAYSSSSVMDDGTAIKKTVDVWIDYFSLRIVLELTTSVAVTHGAVDVLGLGREVWYTAVVMCFFRLAYGRFLSNFY